MLEPLPLLREQPPAPVSIGKGAFAFSLLLRSQLGRELLPEVFFYVAKSFVECC